MDVRDETKQLHHPDENRYLFDCKTRYLPYDKAIMLAMLALKHHLRDTVVMESVLPWSIEWITSSGGTHLLKSTGTYSRSAPLSGPVWKSALAEIPTSIGPAVLSTGWMNRSIGPTASSTNSTAH